MQKRKFTNFHAVQWFSKFEWINTYLSIFGPESNVDTKNRALQALFVWKARNPYLPSAIESTLGLLEVDLQSPKDETQSDVPDRLLRLMYSSVLMRFINHTLDDALSKKLTLSQAAAKVNIPDWIITLRNETAHGHELPSLDLLKNATFFALNWLHDAYWYPEYQKIKNVNMPVVSINIPKDDICHLLHLHNSLLAYQYPVHGLFRICDIRDKAIRSNLFNDVQRVARRPIKLKTPLNVAQSLLVGLMDKLINGNKSGNEWDKKICSILLDNESLFLNGMGSVVGVYKELNIRCLKLWEPLLTLLHGKNIIATLFDLLVDIVGDDDKASNVRKAAAQWLKEISFALNKSKLVRLGNLKSIMERHNHIQNPKTLLVELYPNQKLGLTFDLLHDVPPSLTTIDFAHKVFLNVNPHFKMYIKEFVELIEPDLNGAKAKLLRLIDIISLKSSYSSARDHIYTIEDVKGAQSNSYRPTVVASLQVDNSDMLNNNKLQDNENQVVWKRCIKKYNWGSCPIGLLPWQNIESFNLFETR